MSPPLLPLKAKGIIGLVLATALLGLCIFFLVIDSCWRSPSIEDECPMPDTENLQEEVDALRLEVEALDEQIGVVWDLTNRTADRSPQEACRVFWEAQLLTEAEYVRCQVQAVEDAPAH